MELIFAAACCSVVVSILLKWGKNKGFDPIQMISWNYASASLLCYFWFKPDLSTFLFQIPVVADCRAWCFVAECIFIFS
jgi:hypothetical protein